MNNSISIPSLPESKIFWEKRMTQARATRQREIGEQDTMHCLNSPVLSQAISQQRREILKNLRINHQKIVLINVSVGLEDSWKINFFEEIPILKEKIQQKMSENSSNHKGILKNLVYFQHGTSLPLPAHLYPNYSSSLSVSFTCSI